MTRALALILLVGCASESSDVAPLVDVDPCLLEGVEECAPDCTPPVCDLDGAWNDGHAIGFDNGQRAVQCPPTICECNPTNSDFDGTFRGCAIWAGVECLALCEPTAGFLLDCRNRPN